MTSAAAKIVSLRKNDSHDEHIDNAPIEPGEIGFFVVRSQLRLTVSKLLIEDGGKLTRAEVDGRQIELEGFVLEISIPLVLTISNVGKKPRVFFPALIGLGSYSGRTAEPGGGHLIVPLRRVRQQNTDRMATVVPGMSPPVTLRKLFVEDFQPRRIIAKSDALDRLVLTDLKVGRNSQIAAAGSISLSLFAKEISPILQLDKIPKGLFFDVMVANRDTEPHSVEIEVEGEPVK